MLYVDLMQREIRTLHESFKLEHTYYVVGVRVTQGCFFNDRVGKRYVSVTNTYLTV